MSIRNFQFYIPVKNNFEDVEKTINSICSQKYDKSNIYLIVMDFGSRDGTYERLLNMDSYHFGLYRHEGTNNKRIMLSELARIPFMNSGKFNILVPLYPGEILYPDFCEIINDTFERYHDKECYHIIAECDVVGSDEIYTNQTTIFDEEKMISSEEDSSIYGITGYNHQVVVIRMAPGASLDSSIVRFNEATNESRWWNKFMSEGRDRNVIYLPKKVMKQPPIFYDDEIEEILLRWENLIGLERFEVSQNGRERSADTKKTIEKNIALYALWRSDILEKIKADKIIIEKCRKLAKVIYPELES